MDDPSRVARVQRLRLYSSPPAGRRSRRATDVLLLVGALATLGLLIVAYPPGRLEQSALSFFASLPDWLDPIAGFLYDLLPAWAIVLLVGAAIGRWRVAVQGLAALVVAVALAIVSARLAIGHWPGIAGAILGASDSPEIPALRIAEAGAVVLTIGADLVHGLQRAGHWIVGLGVLGGLVVGEATVGGNLAGWLVALAAGAAVRLAFRTALGQPWPSDIAAALQEAGVTVDGLQPADRQVAGVLEMRAEDGEGRPLVIKIYGSDASDNQLLATFWRRLWYQDEGPTPGGGRGRAVEHEAFLTLLAARAGVATREVVTGIETARGDAVLVLRGAVRPLYGLTSEKPDETALARWWAALSKLRDSRIAHRQIGLSTVALVGEEAGFIDFGQATAAPSAGELMTDDARLLGATAVVAGPGPAVAAAVSALGSDGVTAMLPYLQPAALGGPLSRALKAAGADVDELRKQAATAVGSEEPELVKLRRVTWSSLFQVALLLLAVFAIMKVVGNVDFAELKGALGGAAWGWVAFAFVVAQTPRLTQALALVGSIAAKLRYGPLYVLELATSYLNLALPSTAAKVAVNTRFFQKQGIPGPVSITAGALNSLVSTILKWILVILLVLFSNEHVDFHLESPGSPSFHLLWVIAAIVVAAALLVAVVPKLRREVVGKVRAWWPEVKTSLQDLRASKKLKYLIGGKLATEVLFAAALGLFAQSLGYHIPLSELIVINTGTALVSNLIPVPGGVGVTEFGLTIGLTSVGVDQTSAFAIVVLYRLSTHFLPPIWGFFALRWLKANRYL